MSKAVVIVLADVESHGDLGRVVNALETVKEFQEHGEEVALIFDGAGTRWPAKLADPQHPAHPLYEQVENSVAGVCKYCANAFGAADEAEVLGIPFIAEHDGHPSVYKYASAGYDVVTF